MITGEYNDLVAMAAENVCAADGGPLSVAWHKDVNCYWLRCGRCTETKAIKRVMSLTEEYKTGTELPEPLKSNVEQGMAKRQAKHPLPAGAVTMGGVPATDLGTGELLRVEVIKALIGYAHKYGMDPRRGHICLMYGKPYIELDGYLYHANKQNKPYSLASRPLTKEERPLYQIEDGDYAWIATATDIATGGYKTGLGIITRDELEEMSKKGSSKYANPVLREKPWQMAQKRAEWQAMRRAFPIGESEEVKEHVV
jgi:hypothetical protein